MEGDGGANAPPQQGGMTPQGAPQAAAAAMPQQTPEAVLAMLAQGCESVGGSFYKQFECISRSMA